MINEESFDENKGKLAQLVLGMAGRKLSALDSRTHRTKGCCVMFQFFSKTCEVSP